MLTTITAITAGAAVGLARPARAHRRLRDILGPLPSAAPVAATSAVSPSRLAVALDLLAAALDAGLSPVSALAALVASKPRAVEARMERTIAMIEASGDPRAAWRVLADDAVLGPLGAALARSEQSGAPVAESVRVLAGDSRRQYRNDRLERARRVGVRTAAPLGLCFLPAFFLIAVVPTIAGLIGNAF